MESEFLRFLLVDFGGGNFHTMETLEALPPENFQFQWKHPYLRGDILNWLSGSS